MTTPTTIPAGVDDRWPAGRPASRLSAFFQTMDGSAIGASLEAGAKMSRDSTRTLERARSRGADAKTFTLHGAPRHGGAFTRARTDGRSE